MVRGPDGRSRERGVTYLVLLLAVAIASGVLAAGATAWSQIQRRERETQLLWAGDHIRAAIVAYARAGGDGAGAFPATLQDLLLDPRSLAPRRHLRRLYDDPMTQSTDWALLRDPSGRIVGVHSRSAGVPLKTGRFPALYRDFEKAKTYADWKFTALPPPRLDELTRPAAGASAPAASAPAASAPAAASAPGTNAPAASASAASDAARPSREAARPGPAASAAARATPAQPAPPPVPAAEPPGVEPPPVEPPAVEPPTDPPGDAPPDPPDANDAVPAKPDPPADGGPR